MKTVIPEKVEMRCDCCGQLYGQSIHDGHLTLKRAACDWGGHPVADATLKLDLCDNCVGHMAVAIEAKCTEVRTALRASTPSPSPTGEKP